MPSGQFRASFRAGYPQEHVAGTSGGRPPRPGGRRPLQIGYGRVVRVLRSADAYRAPRPRCPFSYRSCWSAHRRTTDPPGCCRARAGRSISALTAGGPSFDARGRRSCTHNNRLFEPRRDARTRGNGHAASGRVPAPAGPRASGGLVVEEARSEAHVPTQQPSPSQAARVPSPDVDPSGPRRGAVPSPQGAHQAVGLTSDPTVAPGVVWRIRDRRTFVALRRDGVRARSGPLTITALIDSAREQGSAPSSVDLTARRASVPGTVTGADPPRVAFAISRRVGHAVVRNRLRRQLRAICAELAGVSLVPGAYLVSAQPAATALSYSELRSDVQRALSRLNRERSPQPNGNPDGLAGRRPKRRPGQQPGQEPGRDLTGHAQNPRSGVPGAASGA